MKTGTEKKELTAIRLKPVPMSKAKYIAWYERETFTDVIERAVDSEIAKFEKKNGEITEEQIKKAIKKK